MLCAFRIFIHIHVRLHRVFLHKFPSHFNKKLREKRVYIYFTSYRNIGWKKHRPNYKNIVLSIALYYRSQTIFGNIVEISNLRHLLFTLISSMFVCLYIESNNVARKFNTLLRNSLPYISFKVFVELYWFKCGIH